MHDTRRLLSNTWPALTKIRLRCLRVDPNTLLEFFARHKDTLAMLFLRKVSFELNTPFTWLDAAQRAGQLLRLKHAELDVYEWGSDSVISGSSVMISVELFPYPAPLGSPETHPESFYCSDPPRSSLIFLERVILTSKSYRQLDSTERDLAAFLGQVYSKGNNL